MSRFLPSVRKLTGLKNMIMVFWAQVSWIALTKRDYLHQETNQKETKETKKTYGLSNTDVCWFRNPFSHLFDKYFNK